MQMEPVILDLREKLMHKGYIRPKKQSPTARSQPN